MADWFAENMAARGCRWCWAKWINDAIWAQMMEALLHGEREKEKGADNGRIDNYNSR